MNKFLLYEQPNVTIDEIDKKWIEHLSCGLEKRITAIPERAMRHTCLCEFIEGMTAAELVYALYFLHGRAEQGIPNARTVIQEFALEPFALQAIPIEELQEAYHIAIEQNWSFVASYFVTSKERKPETVDEFFTGNEFLDIPLGNRRQAARTQDRFVIDRLLHDRDHRVISLLLNNPRVTEQDVVSIAARRPTQPKILLIISQHRKWGSRYKIRKALTSNPYTPQFVSAQLLSTLMLQDLKFLYNSGSLPSEIRDLAKILIDERKSLRGAGTTTQKNIYDLENTEQSTDWESLFEEAHDALQKLGDIHNTSTTSIQESEEAIVVNPDDEIGMEDDELEMLVNLAEKMLGDAILVPVGEDNDE